MANPPQTSIAGRQQVVLQLALIACLILLVMLVFHPALEGEFLYWDDDYSISNNPHLREPGWPLLKWIFTDVTYMFRYQPLSWIVWSVLYQAFGLQPFYFHLTIVMLHAANAVLAYLLIRRLLEAAQPSSSPLGCSLCAAVGASIWCLHPLRVETTAWAVELVFALPLFFFLLSLLAYLHYAKAGASKHSKFLWMSFVLFVLSLISYPLAIGGIVVFLALDFYPLKRLALAPGSWATPASLRVLAEKIPFAIATFAVGLLNLFIRGHVQASAFSKSPSLAEFGLFDRVMQAFYIWACNLWKPWISFHSSPLPGDLVEFNPWSAPFLFSAFLVMGSGIVSFALRKRLPALFCLWLCHMALLVPMLGLTEHPHFPSDRYSLIVSLTWSILLAGILLNCWRHSLVRAGILGLSILAVACLGFRSYHETFAWQTNIGFLRKLLAIAEGQPRLEQFRFDLSERLAQAYCDKQRFQEAIPVLRQALRIHPDSAEAHYNLGITLATVGDTLAAESVFKKCLELNPGFAPVENKLGMICAGRGDLKTAADYFSRAITDDPRNTDAYCNLAVACNQLNRTREAVALYKQTLEMNPEKISALNNLAWILAANPDGTIRNGAEAVQLAERASRLSGNQDAMILGTLGAAYAEAGRFGDAIKTAQAASDLAAVQGNRLLVEKNQQMIELYKSNTPYHEPAVTGTNSAK